MNALGMTIETWEDMAEEAKKKEKHTFDARGKALEYMERLKDFHGMKGEFINACIELAGEEALVKLSEKILSLRRGSRPNSEKKSK